MNVFNCLENFHLGVSSVIVFISEKIDVLDLFESNLQILVFQQIERVIALSHC